MDMENIRQVLEDAAQIFLSAANTITNERRREAEKVFLQFRRSQFSLDLYRYLIEHSSSSYVVYQTLTALREGIVKEWSSLDDALKEQVVQYLLSYVYTHYSTLSAHVREQALQILVVINKRRKAQRAQMAKNGFTVSLALINLLQSTNNQEFEFGLTLLNAFINEYSFSNANEAGLTIEQRHSVKRDFEENELKTVFELLLNKLQSNLSSISSSNHQLFSSILTTIEKILLWNFSSSFPNTRRTMESSSNVETIDWRPPISWKQLVFDQQLVEFFFHIYATLKSMNETKILLQRRCQILRCLSQLACLNGPLVSDEQCRLRYLTTFSYYFVQTFLINSTLTINLIECGSRCSSEQITYLFEHSQQTLQYILDLFDFYHNYCDQVQIILELFSLYAEHVLIFTKCNYGKKTKEINADEDFNAHIYTLLNCLNHLLAKDFIDFSNDNSANTEVNVGDVVLYGLIICLPLIQSDNLLKIPSISSCYYKLVSSLCEQHSECIFRLLNPDQYSIFLSTIKLGLDNYDNEICKMCLETIQNLTLYTMKQQKLNQTNEKTKYLEHFLDYLLQEIVITTTTLSDLFDTLAGTIYTLICAYPNQFYHIL
ncbi:unnamed protein product [Rotaria sp. Silwood2]|nr:unnamed protein product [Rotaria sp. Silwood2]